MLRRAALVAFAVLLPPVVTLAPDGSVPRAEASVSILLSLDELVAGSTYVVVGTPSDRRSVWEEIGGSRRIVTYTKIDVERAVVGKPPASIWVRTLGGAVGHIGQSVSGEAQLAMGQRALVFVADADGVKVVAGRAQGHFPVGEDRKLRASPDVGGLVPRPGPIASARDELLGVDLDVSVQKIVRAKARHDQK
ncbi:MAG TPA: hypothetical protein VHB21_12190 [Minicystis sp.]|nr:hypothetical protein [Minicystis sp.]